MQIGTKGFVAGTAIRYIAEQQIPITFYSTQISMKRNKYIYTEEY